MPVSKEAHITKLLAKYKNVTATKKEVLEVITTYRSLTYNLQKFVFNDGAAKELFHLIGTIPVVFKQNTYYIPICIWLMDTHPQNAPMCFVKPTANMEIKVSMYVDYTGKIYMPYLHDWQPGYSDLMSLIQVMIVTFGEYPPVYTKSAERSAPYPPNAYMPQPNAGGTVAPSSYLPYPPNSGNRPSGSGAFPAFPKSTPYPPYPAGASMPTPSGAGAAGGSYPPYMNYPPVPGYNSGYNPTPAASSTGTITEEHIKASLISAVEDKMRRRVQEKVNQYQAEIETLNRTKQELMESSSKIDGIIARLQREEVDLQKSLTMLKEKEKELEKNLEVLESSDGIDPDEAVTTTAPLYKQLLNAYSEEAATEDAIYYLGEALRSGVIDLETFLKQVRQLSRKQFMLRALMQKCRQKAGLAG